MDLEGLEPTGNKLAVYVPPQRTTFMSVVRTFLRMIFPSRSTSSVSRK
jgi:hypothetical protein